MFRVRDDLEDRAPQLRKPPLRVGLFDTAQILVDLLGRPRHPMQMAGRGNARVEREAALMKCLAQGRYGGRAMPCSFVRSDSET